MVVVVGLMSSNGELGMTESFGATWMEAFSRRRVASEMFLEWRRLLSAWTRGIILRGSNFDHYNMKFKEKAQEDQV